MIIVKVPIIEYKTRIFLCFLTMRSQMDWFVEELLVTIHTTLKSKENRYEACFTRISIHFYYSMSMAWWCKVSLDIDVLTLSLLVLPPVDLEISMSIRLRYRFSNSASPDLAISPVLWKDIFHYVYISFSVKTYLQFCPLFPLYLFYGCCIFFTLIAPSPFNMN